MFAHVTSEHSEEPIVLLWGAAVVQSLLWDIVTVKMHMI